MCDRVAYTQTILCLFTRCRVGEEENLHAPVTDHAVLVEDAGDALLRPVTAGQLTRLQQPHAAVNGGLVLVARLQLRGCANK